MATLAPSRDLTDAYDRALQLATGQAALRVTRLTRELTAQTFAGDWPILAPALADAVTAAQRAAAEASAWYLAETVRTTTAFSPEIAPVSALVGLTGGGMTVGRYIARTPDVVAVRVANGMDTDLAVGMAQRALSSLATTEPYRVARAAVAQTAIEDRNFAGWQRIPEAGACSFCLTLASRGGSYTSKASAEQTSKALRYHRNCRCRAEAVTTERLASVNAEAVAAYGDLERPVFYRTGTRSAGRGLRPADVARQRASRDFYTTAPRYKPGARTPERLASVRLQIDQIEQRLSTMKARQAAGDASTGPALEWSRKQLAELRAELAQFT